MNMLKKINATKKLVSGKGFLSLGKSKCFAIMGALAVAQIFCEKEGILPSSKDLSFCFYHEGNYGGSCSNCILKDKQHIFMFRCLLEESTEESLMDAMKVYARLYERNK